MSKIGRKGNKKCDLITDIFHAAGFEAEFVIVFGSRTSLSAASRATSKLAIIGIEPYLKKMADLSKVKNKIIPPKSHLTTTSEKGGQENDTALLKNEGTIKGTSPIVESVQKIGKNTGTKPKSSYSSFTCRAGHKVNVKNQPGVGIGVTKCSCGEVTNISYKKGKTQVIKQWHEPKVEPKKDKGAIEEELLARRNFCLSKMEEHRKRSAIQKHNKSNLVGTKRISEPASSMQENLDDFKKPLTETNVEPTSDTADSAVVGEITTAITTTPGLEDAGCWAIASRTDKYLEPTDYHFEAGTLMLCLNSDMTQPYFPWDASGILKTAIGHQPNQNFDQK